jgi:hypothetical protein
MRALLGLSAAGLIAFLVMAGVAADSGSASNEPMGESAALFAGQVTDTATPTAAATTAAATTAAATTAAATATATPAAVPETGGNPDSSGSNVVPILLLAIGAMALAGGAFAVSRAGRTG